LDFIGQIHPPSSKGHHFMLVAMDYFTKWTKVVPLKNMMHKKANGQAESSNKTLIELIKKKIEDNLRRWHEVLSKALWAHHISRHGATKVTPFELVYAQEVILPIEVNLAAYRLAKQNELSAIDYHDLMMYNINEVTNKRLQALKEIEKDKI
jgi:hypothetical protein